jgi:YggT family protein
MYIVIQIVSYAFMIYEFLILIRVLLSWVNAGGYSRWTYHPIVRWLYRLTDPVLVPLQRLIPPLGGAIDISPMIALFLLEIIRRIVVSVLVTLL